MNETQLDYLQAMGVDVYVRRSDTPAPQAPSIDPEIPTEAPQEQAISDATVAMATTAAETVDSTEAGAQSPKPTDSQPPPELEQTPVSAYVALASEDEGPPMDEPPPLDSPYAPSIEPVDFEAVEPAANSEPVNPVASMNWETLRTTVAECQACELRAGCTQTVFGVGHPNARLMIIGEAPGRDEDQQGEPFVGRAGKLLDQMLKAAGFERKDVFIANIVKCRPPNNRDPKAEEATACRAYLERQIDLVQPEVILSVGRVSAQNLLDSEQAVGRMRGSVHQPPNRQTPVHVTYHPAYLLRQPSEKRKVWSDLQQMLDSLDAQGGGTA